MKSEEQSFIDANIEATCALADIDLNDINQDNSKMIENIYKKHGFPVEDEEALLQYMTKYESNPEVVSAIEKGSADCRQKMIDKIMNSVEVPTEEEVKIPVGTGEVSDVE
ncbi:MAG: hypothetical protein RBS56_04570 [Candidatus Gracilibacteria bacterium]|nr:hypothetical protein [Candidatus Gracilibacteria bacterium]